MLREAHDEITRAFRERDLLTFSSAIAFQPFYAIIPLLLFGLGMLGGLGLEEQWTREWAPSARDAMSEPAFELSTTRSGMLYVYLPASAVLVGAQVDALVRERVRNGRSGDVAPA